MAERLELRRSLPTASNYSAPLSLVRFACLLTNQSKLISVDRGVVPRTFRVTAHHYRILCRRQVSGRRNVGQGIDRVEQSGDCFGRKE